MPLPRILPYHLDSPTPWPNRTDWRLDPQRALLLIHDMQNHFIDAFDRSPGSQIDAAVDNTAALRQAFHRAEAPVVYTAQPPAQDPADRQLLTDFWGPGLTDEEAARIIDELDPHAEDTVLTKWRYSAFYRSDLEHRMRNHGKDQLVITGVYSHIGCLATALEAYMRGIQVFFVADAQADFDREHHQMALDYVAGRCGQVCAASAVIEEFGAALRPIEEMAW
ncbi:MULTISPECIES: isochorismatase family protein [Micrococcaceae]|uniref:isochorismatase family protein n=1 Tax=unclassified Kocuria TaxID=2649579 RepID=UPI001EDED639|nr:MULTISPECIES: isochorismatase family protein [unclassified Kocuria]